MTGVVKKKLIKVVMPLEHINETAAYGRPT